MALLSKLPLSLQDDLIERKCLPIIGSGFSRNAVLPAGKSMPDWPGLGASFSKFTDLDSNDPLAQITRYEEIYKTPKTVEKLREFLLIDSVQPGYVHSSFSKLGFPVIATTNFDQLIEDSFSLNRIPIVPIYKDHQISPYLRTNFQALKDGPTILLKLHGDMQDVDSIVASYPHYEDTSTREGIFDFFKTILRIYPRLLLGYSLSDPDIRPIWVRIETTLSQYCPVTYVILPQVTDGDRTNFSEKHVEIIHLQEDNLTFPQLLNNLFKEIMEARNRDEVGFAVVKGASISRGSKVENLDIACHLVIVDNSLDNEQRIKQGTMQPPSHLADYAEFFDSIPGNLSRIRFLTRYADSPEWLLWVHEKGMLDPLFSERSITDSCASVLGWWLADKYIFTHMELIFEILAQNNSKINSAFANIIAQNLQFCELPNKNEIIRKWVAVLIGIEKEGEYYGWFEHLMRRCVELGEVDTVVMLFEHITRPKVALSLRQEYEIKYFPESGKTTLEILPSDQSGMLPYNWQTYLQPNFSVYCKILLPIITSHIQSCYYLRSAKSGSKEPYGIWEIPKYLNGIEKFLYNSAYNSIKWLSQNDRVLAESTIDAWMAAESPLLQNLSFAGFSMMDYQSSVPFKKILFRNLLFSRYAEDEILDILKKYYKFISKQDRKRVLKGFEERFPLQADDEHHFDGLRLLRYVRAALISSPEDTELIELNARLEDLNPHFKDYDEGLTERPPEPSAEWLLPSVSAGELRNFPTEQVLEAIEDKGNHPLGLNREMNLRELSQAIKNDFNWGWGIIDHLVAQNNWERDIWEAIFNAWINQSWTEDQWERILDFIPTHKKLEEHLYYLTWLLSDGMENKEGKIPLSLLGKALKVASKLWDMSVQSEKEGSDPSEKELWVQAMNCNGGKLALFWLHALSKLVNSDDDKWKTRAPELLAILEKVIEGNTESSRYARIVIAGQIPFLWTREEGWTKDHVLPWFDWHRDEDRAFEAWSGFIVSGRPQDNFMQRMYQHYLETARRLHSKFSDKEVGVFIIHIAIMALFRDMKEQGEEWLLDFVSVFTESDRNWFAWKIWEALANKDTEFITEQWIRWIKRYWESRNEGNPTELGAKECGIMITWSEFLKPVFPEMVDVICESTPPTFEHTSLFRDLDKADFPKDHPASLLKLLAFILENAGEDFPKYHFREIVETLDKIENPEQYKDSLFTICNNLARLGYEQSLDLAERMGVLDQPVSE